MKANNKNIDRYLVTVENAMFNQVSPDGTGLVDTRRIITSGASSFKEAKSIWKGNKTKRIYKLHCTGRGVK